MRHNFTDITVVMDRSGSMASCKDDAEGGLNEFIKQQKEAPDEAVFSLVQFDTEYEFVHRGVPIRQVPHCTLTPRGWTALLDAVGRAIVETGERLQRMAEADRPGLVVFVIITDGQENSSKEYTKRQIKEMIRHQQDVYKWQFTYLGANQNAFVEAQGMGIQGAAADYKASKADRAFAAAAGNVLRMRRAAAKCDAPVNAYTPEEKSDMND